VGVFERSDPIKERDKTKDDLKEERVDVELCLDNGLRNDTLASNDVLEKQV